MMRFVWSAIVFAPLFTLCASPVFAQTPAAQPLTEGPFYAEGAVAATFGHDSGSAYGAEIGYKLNDTLHVFVEAGHMGNIMTNDTQVRADRIAAAIGAAATVVQKGNFGDVGIRYRLMDSGRWHPYAAVGMGVVSVDTETSFSSNGDDVHLGADLSGHVVKPLLMIGAGVTTPISGSWFADLSYRFGRIFTNSGAVEDDKAANTQRVQVGFGLRF